MTLELKLFDEHTWMLYDVKEFKFYANDNILMYWIEDCQLVKTLLHVVSINCKK
jgi:hypothetical protein